jgi:hypothetical protein
MIILDKIFLTVFGNSPYIIAHEKKKGPSR